MTGAPTKERRGIFETQTGIPWESHVKIEAESGVLLLNTKQNQGLTAPPQSRSGDEADSPSDHPEGTNPSETVILDFWLPQLCVNTFLLL